MSLREDALKLHRDNRGKLEVTSKVEVKDQAGLSLAYTPGWLNPARKYTKTRKRCTNTPPRATWLL